MAAEKMEEAIKEGVHKELTTLMCTKKSPPQAPLLTGETITPEPQAHTTITSKDVKRIIQEVLKDEPYCNTRNKRPKIEGIKGVKYKIISDKIEKHVPQGYWNG